MHAGPREEAQGLVRRQKESKEKVWKNTLLSFLWEGMGKVGFGTG